jgi:hypothetical protein
MRKKSNTGHPLSYLGNQNTSFSTLLDVIDPEREAQRQEHLKRKKENPPLPYPKQPKKTRKPAFKSTSKPKGITFEENLERTQKWLETTFPALFDPTQPCKPLDVHILRDIKAHYKNWHVKRKYPGDLVIRAALYRYLESPAYLACLVEGAPRYNIDGDVVGSV